MDSPRPSRQSSSRPLSLRSLQGSTERSGRRRRERLIMRTLLDEKSTPKIDGGCSEIAAAQTERHKEEIWDFRRLTRPVSSVIKGEL